MECHLERSLRVKPSPLAKRHVKVLDADIVAAILPGQVDTTVFLATGLAG